MPSNTPASRKMTPKKPLNCPKGYGLCWGCETWCDGYKPEPESDDERQFDADFGNAMGLDGSD